MSEVCVCEIGGRAIAATEADTLQEAEVDFAGDAFMAKISTCVLPATNYRIWDGLAAILVRRASPGEAAMWEVACAREMPAAGARWIMFFFEPALWDPCPDLNLWTGGKTGSGLSWQDGERPIDPDSEMGLLVNQLGLTAEETKRGTYIIRDEQGVAVFFPRTINEAMRFLAEVHDRAGEGRATAEGIMWATVKQMWPKH